MDRCAADDADGVATREENAQVVMRAIGASAGGVDREMPLSHASRRISPSGPRFFGDR